MNKIYILILTLFLSSCGNKDAKQEVSIDMSKGDSGFVDRVISSEKFTLHENGEGYDLELFEIFDGDMHYKMFRDDIGGMTNINFTKDSLQIELLKLQIKNIKDGSSSDKKADK